MFGRRRYIILALALLLTALAIGALVYRSSGGPEWVTAAVKVGDVEQTVLATGKLRPKELVSVGAQVSGQVKRLHVSLGQFVRAGEPIAEIDDEPQRLALRNAEAAIDALRAQRAAREAALVQTELALRRQEMMLAADATARADFEAARAARDTTRRDVESLAAQIVQARTQADTARINLAYTRIVAPMDGVVVAVVTKQGQTVNSFQSAPTIVMLAKLDVMTVRAEISEADVGKLRPGQAAWFTTLGEPDRRRHAKIERIEPAPESIASDNTAQSSGGSQQQTSTAIYYQAQFDVPNPDGALRPSMTVQVSVLLARAGSAVIVPVTALGPRAANGRTSVKVVDARGKVARRSIRVGISDESNAAVLSGLRPGEKVVLSEAKEAPSINVDDY